jgi:hypothetical protein
MSGLYRRNLVEYVQDLATAGPRPFVFQHIRYFRWVFLRGK